MNVEAANNWPLMLVPLPKERTIQNEFIVATISPQHRPNPEILNNVSEIESNGFWAKGSFIDIYV